MPQLASVLYRLALSCWLGGAVLFTFVLTPTIFRSYGRDLAGEIVGRLFPGYFSWGLACGLISLIFCVISQARRQAASTVIIVVMLAITALQAWGIEPRAAALKREIPSFETTPADHPQRRAFRRLHAVSALANLGTIAGGVVLIALL